MSGVDEAIRLATELVRLTKRGQQGGTARAIEEVARYASVTESDIRRLVQPSRRPKIVSLDLWGHLWGAYLAYLERELRRLEAEVARVQALGPAHHGPLTDLERRTTILIAQIRANL